MFERVAAAGSVARIARRHLLVRRGHLGLLVVGAAFGFGSRWLALDDETMMLVVWSLQAVMLAVVIGFVASIVMWRRQMSRELRRLLREELERSAGGSEPRSGGRP